MAKSKLKQALNRQLGIDPKREKQLKISRKPSKKVPELVDTSLLSKAAEQEKSAAGEGASDDEREEEKDDESEKDDSEEEEGDDDDEDGEDDEDEEDEEEEEEEEEDFALSDISDNDLEGEDVIPHQKLTIDNHAALTQLRKTIALPLHKLRFSEHQSVTASAPLEIGDIDDDLGRELAFYKQALEAARTGRALLKKEGGVGFERPADYFAEMMKDDEHMGKIKQKLLDEAEGKKRAQEARKLRDLKKFGKQVQVQKLQEREKAKKDTLDKIQILKRKRKESDNNFTGEDSSNIFDVALEEQTKDARRRKGDPRKGDPRKGDRAPRDATGRANPKRAKRDEKYGFGGKKRFSKSGDAMSSGDLSAFSSGKNRAGFGGTRKRKSAPRPGKSRRAAKR